MRFSAGRYIVIAALFFLASLSQIISQYRLLSRNNPEIPDPIEANLRNEHRKLMNLNGEWSILSADPVLNSKVSIPFCYDFNGKVTLRRDFNADLEYFSSWNFIICAEGINYQCDITINGKYVAKHEGGFTAFSFLIPDGLIKKGNNVIEIRIDNTLDVSRTLPLKNIAGYPKNYGGIYRDIYILAVPRIFVKSVNTTSDIDINMNADVKNSITVSATDISGYALVDNKLNIKTELIDSAGNIAASSDAVFISIASNSTIETENKFTLNNPVYWTIQNPYLYKLRVIISSLNEVIDEYTINYGILEHSRKAGIITLNQKEIKLNGLNYIEEYNNGLCGTYEEISRDIANLKSLGCNIIKVFGKPAGNYLIDICNKNGLLIMEELPVHTVPASVLESEIFINLAENQIDEMISQHKNNPCIYAYGLGNDFDVSGIQGFNFVKRIAELSKKADNRPIYYSTRNYNEDICRELVDMTGYNFYDNDASILKNISSQIKIRKEKIFLSNYGKIINPLNFSGYSDPVSLEAQSKFIADIYKIYKSSSFSGAFFQSYTDWNSDVPNLRYFDKPNQYMRTTGLYTLYREARPPSVIMRKHFLNEDIPNMNIGTYSKEAPLLFVFTGLLTFIVFIYITNSVRRFRENISRAIFRPFIFFTDVREQNLIPAFHNILLAIIISIGNGLFFANLLYFWKDSQLFDIILSVFISGNFIKLYSDVIINNPVNLVITLSAITFVRIFIISIIIWMFSWTLKYRIGFGNIYTVTVWGLLPTILLLAAGTFYLRILNMNTDFVVIGIGFAFLLHIISIYRILKGIVIIFDVFYVKVYGYGIITIIFIAGIFWYYFNSSRLLFEYIGLVMLFLKN